MSKNLGFYEEYIHCHFTFQHCGIDWKEFGKVTDEIYFPIDSIGEYHYSFTVKERAKSIIDFVTKKDNRPLWCRINVIDQAINDYIGIGWLNLKSDWIQFILDYLNNDRAEQSGDTICILFDENFEWAICFTLSQDNDKLIIEKYQK